MKFLCENCKAKYQIGDEKVAGKTVRMKCRRCGHAIVVSAKLTESSVARGLPEATPPPSVASDDAAPESGPGPIPRNAAPLPVSTDDESTVIMQSPLIRPNAGGARPAAPARPGAPPRPAAGAAPVAPQRTLAGPGPARPAAPARIGGLSAVARGPGGATALATPTPQANHPTPQPVAAPAPSPAAATPEPGGVAAAFQRAVAEPLGAPPPSAPQHEDWYVGVGGAPLGPVRVDVIREKALLGQVDGESLVWREGFDEWQPLKTFPDLREIVRAAQAARLTSTSGRTFGAALAPVMGAPAPAPAPAPTTPYAAPPAATSTPFVSAAPAPAPGPAALFEVKPDAPHPAGVGMLADPFAAPAAPTAPSPPLAKSAEAAAPPTAARPSVPPESLVIPMRRSGMHPMAYAFIGMASLFGGVAAYVLLVKPPLLPQIVVVQGAPAPGQPAPGTAAAAAAAPTSETAAPAEEPSAGPVAAKGKKGAPRAKASTAPTAVAGNAVPFDTSGLGSSVDGPNSNGPSNDAPAGGGQLSQSEISSVVTKNQARVKHQCWEPALAGRSAGGPSNARVSATITITPSGAVDSANASGADAFPGLASCIAGKMRAWRFPSSGSPTTVNVPFYFAGQ